MAARQSCSAWHFLCLIVLGGGEASSAAGVGEPLPVSPPPQHLRNSCALTACHKTPLRSFPYCCSVLCPRPFPSCFCQLPGQLRGTHTEPWKWALLAVLSGGLSGQLTFELGAVPGPLGC